MKYTSPSRGALNAIIAAVLAVTALAFFANWYNTSYLSAERVFWSTINQNLQTGFVTRTSENTYETGEAVKQVTNIQYAPELLANTTVTIANPSQKERVTSETIGTTTADYLRYTELQTNKTTNTKEVVNVWAVQKGTESNPPQVLSDALIGSVLLFGNLNKSQREQLINQMQTTNAFKSYNLTGKSTINGRKVYTYKIEINLKSYVAVYKEYLKMIGQENLAKQLGDQQEGAVYTASLQINATSRQPIQLAVENPDQKETYSNLGYFRPIQVPSTDLPISELQSRLNGN